MVINRRIGIILGGYDVYWKKKVEILKSKFSNKTIQTANRFLKLRNARNTRKGLVDESLVLDLGAVPEVDQEAVAFLLVHFDACADDPVALLLEEDLFSHFRAFRVFRSSLIRSIFFFARK